MKIGSVHSGGADFRFKDMDAPPQPKSPFQYSSDG
jgi:hypothetical protein